MSLNLVARSREQAKVGGRTTGDQEAHNGASQTPVKEEPPVKMIIEAHLVDDDGESAPIRLATIDRKLTTERSDCL